MKNKAGFKEKISDFFRRQLVSLKIRPVKIPMFMLVICMLVFMLSMTSFSNTTAVLSAPNMGVTNFAATLLSILTLVTFMNSFPKRKKTNVFMLVLTFVFIVLIIFCDVCYYLAIQDKLYGDNPFQVGERTYIYTSANVLIVHLILLGVASLSIALLPVYSKLLKRINTTAKVDSNENIGEIHVRLEE